MDTHYDVVMQAAAAAGDGTRLYFGYSTILDRAAFDEWKQEHGYADFRLPHGRLAEALDVALDYNFPSRWWGGRVAGLSDASGQSVWGLLFELQEKDWPIIGHKEGIVTGMSVERAVRLRVGGQLVEATAFTTHPERRQAEGPVSDRFVEALVRGAQESGLPGEWVAALKAA